MTISAADESPRAGEDPAFRDAVTFSFGDAAVGLYGLARLTYGSNGVSGFAVVHHGEEVVGSSMQTTPAAPGIASWDELRAAGVRTTIRTPLAEWSVAYVGDHDTGFDLRFEAVSAPAALSADSPVAQAGGAHGYEQICNVSGIVRVAGRSVNVRCLGQRGHLWGVPDWSRIELARTLSAWLDAERAVMLTAVRPAKAKHHDEEIVEGFVIDGGTPVAIVDPRLSTTYDGENRQRRAGLELWMQDEGGLARRAAGEAVCGTSIDLGELHLTSAFFHWRMEGHAGVGRYDVVRRVELKGGGSRRRR